MSVYWHLPSSLTEVEMVWRRNAREVPYIQGWKTRFCSSFMFVLAQKGAFTLHWAKHFQNFIFSSNCGAECSLMIKTMDLFSEIIETNSLSKIGKFKGVWILLRLCQWIWRYCSSYLQDAHNFLGEERAWIGGLGHPHSSVICQDHYTIHLCFLWLDQLLQRKVNGSYIVHKWIIIRLPFSCRNKPGWTKQNKTKKKFNIFGNWLLLIFALHREREKITSKHSKWWWIRI